jgi:thioredoxin-dependent peroxiredoxin
MLRTGFKVVLLSAGAALVAGAVVVRAVFASDDLLSVGAVAPDLTGKDASGKSISLFSQKRRFAVVYFYPKDETPGCTKEACAFRDASAQLAAAGVTVFAVSRDGDASHREFRDKHQLPFPMVADPSGEVQRAYRVPSVMIGTGLASRVTFLVGPDGKIVKVWPKVNPLVNAREVLDTVAALGAKPR